MVVVVHDGQGVEFLVPDEVVRILEGDVLIAHDELGAGRHELGDLLGVVVTAGAVIAARHDAEQLAARRAVVGHGHGGVARLVLEGDDLLHGHVGREGGIGLDETRLVVLDRFDHGGLGLGGLGAVDEGDAALGGKGDAHVDTGNGLHDGGDHRDVEGDLGLLTALEARQRGLERHVVGDALRGRVARDQQVLRESMGLTREKRCHVAPSTHCYRPSRRPWRLRVPLAPDISGGIVTQGTATMAVVARLQRVCPFRRGAGDTTRHPSIHRDDSGALRPAEVNGHRNSAPYALATQRTTTRRGLATTGRRAAAGRPLAQTTQEASCRYPPTHD